MGKYEKLAKKIIEYVGGTENIASLSHCVTRLRFCLKDESKADTDKLKGTEGVLATFSKCGQFQVVIGPKVNDVYDAVYEAGNINVNDAEVVDLEGAKEIKKKSVINSLISLITDIFSPFYGVLIGFGILKGTLPLLAAFGLIDSTGSTYNVLYSLSDGIFYYIPILLAYTASKKFGLPVMEGLAIGAGLLYPSLLSSSMVLHGSLFGIPIIMPPSGDYTFGVIPIICAIAFAAWFEGVYKKHIPEVIKPFTVPFITCIVTYILTLWIIGPVTAGLTNGLAIVLNKLADINGLLLAGVLGTVWLIVLASGLQWAVLPIIINNIALLGYDTTLASTFGVNFAMIGALLAICIKTKSRTTKGLCLSTLIPTSVGIIEPGLYGVVLQRKKILGIVCAVSGAIGVGMTYCNIRAYRVSGFGVLGYTTFTDTKTGDVHGMILALIWSVVAVIVSFIISLLVYKDEQNT